MNPAKTNFEDRIQQNHGMTTDFAIHSSQSYVNQQNWNIGIQAESPVIDSGMQQPNFRPDKTSNSIMSRFDSPGSAFYATERFMGFSQFDCQVNLPMSGPYSKSYNSQNPWQHSSSDSYVIGSLDQQVDRTSEPRSNLQSVVKSHFADNQYQESYKGLCSNSLANKLHQLERNQFSIPFQRDQDHNRQQFGSSQFTQLGFSPRQEMQSPRILPAVASLTSGNSMATGTMLTNKTRIRWNQDLHEKFVECVNRLGGAEKATPKAILKLMDSDGLTIFHVKSHLQKYRIAKYMTDPSEGKADKRSSICAMPQMDTKTGLEITEALQLQLDVQRRLHEQLEIQKNLQLRIEEQGRQLKKMFDEQQRTNSNIFKNKNSDITSADDTAFSIEDVEISILEGSNSNANFPSKIS